MITIENLYWVLYENLLKPINLDCWYYYPFGTTENFSHSGEFSHYDQLQNSNHVLFHFDQEPIWSENLGKQYDALYFVTWSNKKVKILANSEKSQIKKHICRDRYLLDWYFFYHGFAALNWFQDSRYVGNCQDIVCTFNSMNHIINHERSYRLVLLARLMELGVADNNDISVLSSINHCLTELENPNTRLSEINKKLILKNLIDPGRLPLIIDHKDVDGSFSARLGHREFRMWQRSFLHIVNETVFYEPKLHLTEKIFKPIIALRPFILAGAPGNLSYLRSYGFKTFGDWIDESYDDISDNDLRLEMIVKEVANFCNLSIGDLRKIYQDMLPILEYNKKHFFGEFRHIIVNELIDNFDACIKIWNNGRVDDRNISYHPNLNAVKQILLS